MISQDQLEGIVGQPVLDANGDKIGKAGQVYTDDETGTPDWLTVNTGLFGTSESLVPLRQATVYADGVRVPYDKSLVKEAPRLGNDGHLNPDEEERLYIHYGLSAAGTSGWTGRTTADADLIGAGEAHAGHDTSGPNTDTAMTRSEEHLRVGTERREAGRARLRKYVVTEQQTVTVPVTHEEVRVEREPITRANREAAMSGPTISEEEHEVVLHEERPVVATEAVPVERVRLETDAVTETEHVSGDVRKEVIDVDAGRESRVER
jgi:uncharacterized protein (TIGR02271 family)